MSKTTLDGVSALYLLCYAYGHRWEPNGSLMAKGGYQEDEFICACGSRKWELWEVRTRATWGRPRYDRPRGYSLGYRVTREDAKRELRARTEYRAELRADRLLKGVDAEPSVR